MTKSAKEALRHAAVSLLALIVIGSLQPWWVVTMSAMAAGAAWLSGTFAVQWAAEAQDAAHDE